MEKENGKIRNQRRMGWWLEKGHQEPGKRVGDREPWVGEGLERRDKEEEEKGWERGTGGWGVLPRDETKRLLVTTSTWEALHSQSACLPHLFSQGVAGGPDGGCSELRALGVAVRDRG